MTGRAPTGRAASARAHEARRLHDLIRAAVLGGGYPDGQLPGEAELMADHGATRACVREALELLRTERLIERTQGVGTHAVVAPERAQMEEALGVLRPARGAMFDPRFRPKVLDSSTVPVPRTLTGLLGVEAGLPCLRLDYVSLHDDEPFALATNYVLYPEAERLAATAFRHDWYTLLEDAGVRFGESEFVMDSVPADPRSARLLRVPEGTALLAMDQTIRDHDERAFNVAFIRMRTDRFRFVTRARVGSGLEHPRTPRSNA